MIPALMRQVTAPDVRSGNRGPTGPVPAHVHLRERERFLMRQPMSALRDYAGQMGFTAERSMEKSEIVRRILSAELRPELREQQASRAELRAIQAGSAYALPTGSVSDSTRQVRHPGTPVIPTSSITAQRMQSTADHARSTRQMSTADDERLARQLQQEENHQAFGPGASVGQRMRSTVDDVQSAVRSALGIRTTADDARSSRQLRSNRAAGATSQQALEAQASVQHLAMAHWNRRNVPWSDPQFNSIGGGVSSQGMAVDLGSVHQQQRQAAMQHLRWQATAAADHFEESRRAAFDFGPASRQLSAAEAMRQQQEAQVAQQSAQPSAPNFLVGPEHQMAMHPNVNFGMPLQSWHPFLPMMSEQGFGQQAVGMPMVDPVAFLQAVTAEQDTLLNRGVDPGTIDANTSTMTYTGASGGAAAGSSSAPAAANESADDEAARPRVSSGAQFSCSICLEVFQTGEQLRILPCLHKYHQSCIDSWLARSPACPVCKYEIVATGEQSL